MIKIKHFMEAAEPDDGQRIWIEPIGLTKDMQQWCEVQHLLSNLGPPMMIWRWFQDHPEGYDYFRGKYHEYLSQNTRRQALAHLALVGAKADLTLLHQGDDPEHNSATALYEYLAELQAYPHQE